MTATKLIFSFFYQLQIVPNHISLVFLSWAISKENILFKNQRTPGKPLYIAPVRILAVKFWFNSPKINLFNKCTTGFNKAGVLWSKYILILLLQLYLLSSASQHFYNFKTYVQSISPQSEEFAGILPLFFLEFMMVKLFWAYNTRKRYLHLKITVPLAANMNFPPCLFDQCGQF